MKKMSKKDLILSIILILNIGFITIPYSLKNMDLNKELQNLNSRSNFVNQEPTYDFYLIYSQFDEVLKDLEIKPIHKKADFSQNSLQITIDFKANIQKITNLLTYLNKKIPNLVIISSNIDINKNSQIVFYIEN